MTIISGGFKEIGEEGKALEREIVGIAGQYAIRIIGPNCVGTMNLTGLNTTFIKGIQQPELVLSLNQGCLRRCG